MHKYLKIVFPVLLAGACLAAVLAGLGGTARAEPLVWTQAAAIPEPRAANLVQCPDDPDGFYLVGGIGSGDVTVDTLYHYDAVSNMWISLEVMPEPLRAMGAACYQGKIYIAGGWVFDDVKNTLYIYDIASDSWSQGADLPDDVLAVSMGAWDGKLYLAGGSRGGDPYPPVDRVDVYDITSGVWTAGGGTQMPTAASFYGVVQRGPYLYAVGGWSGDFDNNVDQTQRFDMSSGISGTWEVGPTFVSQRALLGISMTGSRLYAQGGDLNGGYLEPADLVEYLDLSGWPGGTWTDLGDPVPEVNLHPVGACTEAMTGGEIWAVGGALDFITIYDTNLYRPAEACYDFYFGNLTPESLAGEGYRGATVSYDLTLHNDGTLTDTFDINLSAVWTTTAPAVVGPLAPGESAALSVTVEVPYGATAGDMEVAQVVAASQGDPSVEDSALITTTAVTDWVEAAPIPEERAANLVQCPDDPDGFYLVGGVGPGGTTDTLYHYDAVTDEWDTLAPLPEPRQGVAAACYDGKIYAAGGLDGVLKDSLYIYDIASDSWSSGPTLPDIILGAALGAWDGKLYLVGGTRINYPWPPVDRVDVYDLASGTWTVGGGTSMPTAASVFGAVQRGPYLYAVGGFSEDFDNNVNQTQRYDMSINNWEVGPTFGSQRAGAQLSMTGARLYAQGGDLNGGAYDDATDLVEYLDLSSWPGGAWVDLGDPLPAANRFPAGACTEAMGGGEIWAVGGAIVPFGVLDTNLYRPAEPCLGYNYIPALAPEAQSGEARPGMTVSYTLTLTNAGDTPDAFDLSASSSWTVTLSGLTGALYAGESVTLTVDVHIPQEATPYEMNTTVITAASQGDPNMTASAILTTTVLPEFGLELGYETNELSRYPGEMVAYSLMLTNTGTYTDTYELAPSGNTWEVHLPVTTTTLGTGEMVEVIVHVTIPVDAMNGDMDMVTITASSQGDPGVQSTSVLTTTAIWRSNYLPLVRNP